MSSTVAVLFSDIQGFSKLKPDEVDLFVNGVLGALGNIIAPHRSHLIEVNTWGDAIFATSTDIQVIARMALEIRDFFLHPRVYADFIREKLRIRIALDFVDVEIGPNCIIPGQQGCHGSELTRAARLEPVTPSNTIFVTEAFRDTLQRHHFAVQFQLVEFPHELHLPKAFAALRVFSLHWNNEIPRVEYNSKLRELDAIGPMLVDSWFVEGKPRHQEVASWLDPAKGVEQVWFICITGRSFILPHLYGGDDLIEKSLVAGALKRDVKFKGIVLDPDCSEARFRSEVESPGELDGRCRLLQDDARKVKGLVHDAAWQSLMSRVSRNLILKKTRIGLSFSLLLFVDRAAIIEPYHYGKLPERAGEPHMCKFSQFTVFKARDEEYRMLKKHFENLWESSAYVWPDIHGPRSPRIRALINPGQLHEKLRWKMVGSCDAGIPIRVEHLVSNTLKIGPRLQAAFTEVGPQLGVSCNLREAKKGQDLDQFVRQAITGRSDFVLLQVHGIEGEERLLGPLFKAKEDLEKKDPNARLERLIVYIHRPEEFILRTAWEEDIALKRKDPQKECPYFIAKELVQQKLRKAAAVVLSGDSFVDEYQEMLPDVPVVAIPLGFVESGVDVDLTSRLDAGAVTFIGSDTTWGEMRWIDDLRALMEAIRFSGGNLKTTGYATGKFDHNCDLTTYRGQPDLVFLSNQDIGTAYSRGDFQSESGFREWLYLRAPGKLIVRARAENSRIVPESFSELPAPLKDWENQIIDFNVQLYREILDRKREPGRRGQPKVEYSGTLHKGAANVVFVVFESPAMDDVERDEGFRMVQVPMSKGNPHFHETAAKIVRLICNPSERREMLEHNRASCKLLGMNEIAFAFCTLMRQLADVGQHA